MDISFTLKTYLSSFCTIFCSHLNVINAESKEDDIGNNTIQVVIVGFLAVVTVVSVLLLCAGDKVEHSDRSRENIGRHNQTKTTTPSKKNHRQAFEEVEVEFSKPTKANEHIPLQSKVKRNDEKLSQDGFERLPPIVKTEANKENGVLIVNDESESRNRTLTSQSSASRDDRQAPYNSDISTCTPITPPVFEDTSVTINSGQSHTENIHQGDAIALNYGRQSIGSNHNNRQNTGETGDDFGYHSDFSKSVKQDTDSNQLSTFRSSQNQSNARSAASYDIDDDVIETYTDDGQSIDWN